MEMYQQVIEYFASIPSVKEWNDVQALFARIASRKPYHWFLPVRTCEAAGGTLEQAIPAVAAIGCAHISIILVDDMLDFDPRGEFQKIGAPAAANLACAFQAAGLEAIIHERDNLPAKSLALASLNKMYFNVALGQHWDVQCPTDETAYWKMVRTKSSPFFGVALQIGAIMGGTVPDEAEKLEKVGELYGEMIQIHDDLNDSLAVPASPDWLQGRLPLPILFAHTVEHPDRARFRELRQAITGEGALNEAQEILLRCGAVSYCIDQLLHRYQAAQEILKTVRVKHPSLIEKLLEDVVAPAWKLLDATGKPFPFGIISL